MDNAKVETITVLHAIATNGRERNAFVSEVSSRIKPCAPTDSYFHNSVWWILKGALHWFEHRKVAPPYEVEFELMKVEKSCQSR